MKVYIVRAKKIKSRLEERASSSFIMDKLGSKGRNVSAFLDFNKAEMEVHRVRRMLNNINYGGDVEIWIESIEIIEN